MADFAAIALSIAMVVGPVVGYIDQYFLIRRKRSSAGFNSLTCGVLLIANILRVFFWLGKRFDTTLLFQSIAMIIVQLLLLEIVVRYRPDPSPDALYQHLPEEDNSNAIDIPHRLAFLRPFWSWKHFLDYLNFILGFTTVVAVAYLIFGKYIGFIETLGFLSLGIESTLPIPQCVSNFKKKSTAGFSLLVLASWFFGDGFKVFYFIFTHSPIQFIICGAIQLSIDTIIVFQFMVFSEFVRKRLGIKSTSDPNLGHGLLDDHDSDEEH